MARASVYLAGPDVFRAGFGAEEYARKREDLRALGFEPLVPVEDAMSRPEDIYEGNVELVERCDVVLCDLAPFRGPSADVGTVWEMAYGFALGCEVLAYNVPSTPYNYRAKGDALHPVVEAFGLPDNLMLVGCARVSLGMAHSWDAALQILDQAYPRP